MDRGEIDSVNMNWLKDVVTFKSCGTL